MHFFGRLRCFWMVWSLCELVRDANVERVVIVGRGIKPGSEGHTTVKYPYSSGPLSMFYHPKQGSPSRN